MSVEEQKFTPPPIKGYRSLTQTEVDLMNEIKQKGIELQELILLVQNHIIAQQNKADASPYGAEEWERLDAAQPERWMAIGRTHFQEGLMALTRSVAQPGFF
jgi:hypothetical protein